MENDNVTLGQKQRIALSVCLKKKMESKLLKIASMPREEITRINIVVVATSFITTICLLTKTG